MRTGLQALRNRFALPREYERLNVSQTAGSAQRSPSRIASNRRISFEPFCSEHFHREHSVRRQQQHAHAEAPDRQCAWSLEQGAQGQPECPQAGDSQEYVLRVQATC